MPLISIIVPVYNVEKYLNRCVDSILAQTFADFELILVDDGSPDRCGEICDEYAERDERIKVIHQKNGGVSKARNAGLKASIGKYTMFCDSDDSLPDSALHVLWSAIVTMDTDMVVGDFERICINKSENSIQSKKSIERAFLLVEMNDSDSLYSFWRANNILSSCGRLFKSEYIRANDIRFNEDLIVMEDYAFVIDYLSYCRKVCMIPDIVYHYYSYSDSSLLERRSRRDFFDDVVYVSDKLERFLKSISNERSELFIENTIYPTLKYAYDLLWGINTPTRKSKIVKYARIKRALSQRRFQNALECYKNAYSPWVYCCMRKRFPLGILIAHKLHSII